MEHMYLSVCFVSPQAHTHGHGATPEMSDKDARRFLSRKQRMGAAAAVAASRGGTRKNLPHAAEVGNREGDPVIALRDTVVHPPLFPKSLWALLQLKQQLRYVRQHRAFFTTYMTVCQVRRCVQEVKKRRACCFRPSSRRFQHFLPAQALLSFLSRHTPDCRLGHVHYRLRPCANRIRPRADDTDRGWP